MGGNAFPALKDQMTRIHRDDILPLVDRIADALAIPHLTPCYLANNLMGSALKQETSGDLDFALNNREARCVGMESQPVFRIATIAERCLAILPKGYVSTKTLPGGQFQSLWPVSGTLSGLVQVDFLEGSAEWLRFSHWSPGKDVSPWKGVMISTMLGVLAKMHIDWELFDEDGYRQARVGLYFHLEGGLIRRWSYRNKQNQGLRFIDPDEFETIVTPGGIQRKPMPWDTGAYDLTAWDFLSIISPSEFESRFPGCPRFARIGYITNPEAALGMLFGVPTRRDEVDTFEKIVAHVRKVMPDRFEEVRMRFIDAFERSAGTHDYTVEEVAEAEVWKCC